MTVCGTETINTVSKKPFMVLVDKDDTHELNKEGLDKLFIFGPKTYGRFLNHIN
jgi:hypothetical protein